MRKIIILAFPVMIFLCAHAYAGSFTDNGDSTVTDNFTGLMWQQEDGGNLWTWEEALIYCEGLTFASYGDWRLPNIKELESITDDTVYSPAADTAYFPGVNLAYYWSSTATANLASYAWLVQLGGGGAGYNNKTDPHWAWCVR